MEQCGDTPSISYRGSTKHFMKNASMELPSFKFLRSLPQVVLHGRLHEKSLSKEYNSCMKEFVRPKITVNVKSTN